MKLYLSKLNLRKILEHLKKQTEFGIYGSYSDKSKVATVDNVSKLEPGQSFTQACLFSTLSSDKSLFRLNSNEKKLEIREKETDKKIEIIKYDDNDYFKRTPYNKVVMKSLKEKSVMIVGLGSVGSVIAKEIGAAGVGKIIGIDKDIVEVHNCYRHILGTKYVGWPKPYAMKYYFASHAPKTQFFPIYEDIFTLEKRREERRIEEIVAEYKPDLILAVTDVLNVQYLCQRVALEYDIPMMAVGCSNNAVEGEIFIWTPGQAKEWQKGREKKGCYACLRPEDVETITRSSNFDYSSDDPESYGGEPALASFINKTNITASIFVLSLLLQNCASKTKIAEVMDEHVRLGLQYVRLGGPYKMESENLTAKRKWSVEWYRVPKKQACSICSDKKKNTKVLFPPREEKKLEDEWLDDIKNI